MGVRRHVATSVSLTPVMLGDLKAEAERRDVSLSQIVREYIRSGQIRGLDTQGELDLRRMEGTNDHGS